MSQHRSAGISRPMRLVAATRVRNEDDIIEAFVRHHAILTDYMILLDDGSTDRTREILASLKREGLPISVYTVRSAHSVEAQHCTFLFRQAVTLAADWVLCLDCDEFIDIRKARDLRAALAAVPAGAEAVHVDVIDYHMTSSDDRSEPIVPRRLRYRQPAPGGLGHVFPRARLAALGARMTNGNHAVEMDGSPVATVPLHGVRLAHFPARSGWQVFAKSLVGRLKVLAAGRAELDRQTAQHYTGLVDNLWTHPEWLFADETFLHGRAPEWVEGGVVNDPMQYFGGPLRFTAHRDASLHALRSAVSHALHLAECHGALLDASSEARALSQQRDSAYEQVL